MDPRRSVSDSCSLCLRSTLLFGFVNGSNWHFKHELWACAGGDLSSFVEIICGLISVVCEELCVCAV